MQWTKKRKRWRTFIPDSWNILSSASLHARAEPHRFQHQGTTSSDINIEEKLNISMTNRISISNETMFRLLPAVCDRLLTLLVLEFTDEIHFSRPLELGTDQKLSGFNIFQKGSSGIRCLVLNEKHTQKKTWAMPAATFLSGWTLQVSLK